MDETKLKVDGQHLFIWLPRREFNEALAVDACWQRSEMNTEHVLKKALGLCLNKPLVLADEGPWCKP